MDDVSPPKRVTRARAAKSENTIKTTKIATAASRAKVAKPKATTPTKRKSPADEEDEQNEPEDMDKAPKKGRGRPKRQMIEQPEPEEEDIVVAPVKPVTTRSSRKTATAKEAVEEAPVPAPAPAKATRGRPKKIIEETPIEPPKTRGRPRKVTIAKEVEEEMVEQKPEPVKKTTRATATAKKPTATAKKVTFQDSEPDKENIVPSRATRGKPEVVEEPKGLKAKPVRKPAPKRATRGRKAADVEPEVEKKKSVVSPLSPKKATQVTAAKDIESEDELATMEKTPMRPLHQSPIKAPGSLFGTAKKLDFTTSIVANKADIPKGPDFGASILASPARRPPPSPYKDALKASPHRLNLGESKLESPFKTAPKPTSSFKESLLQSPARRPPSPTKENPFGSPSHGSSIKTSSIMTPQVRRFDISRFGTPKTTTKDLFRSTNLAPASVARPHTAAPKRFQSRPLPSFSLNAPQLSFSGRLSSVMPRETDPVASPRKPEEEAPIATDEAMSETQPGTVESIPEETAEETAPETIEEENEVDMADPLLSSTQSTTPPTSPPRSVRPVPAFFNMRVSNEDPFQDSDSEDELALDSPMYSPAPLRQFNISTSDFAVPPSPKFTPLSATPKASRMSSVFMPQSLGRRESSRLGRSAVGMTPLAHQLGDWMAATPEAATPDKSEKPESEEILEEMVLEDDAQVQNSPAPAPMTFPHLLPGSPAISEASPLKTTFFEDEMVILDDVAAQMEGDDEDELSPIEPDEQDFAFAEEADEMSLIVEEYGDDIIQSLEDIEEELESMAQEQADIDIQDATDVINAAGISSSDTSQLSEASQEYGDENATPEEPIVAVEEPAPAPADVTPVRPMANRVFHTVSKVPLKPAADHTPRISSPMKRSATVSRVPTKRPGSSGSSCVTPVKRTPQQSRFNSLVPPSPNVIPSNVATPCRTPRPDLNPETLRGAIVFVDVHTTEGADASGIFVELLVQMGARCVKSWNWNGEEKVGITHVVFKDGGKRTMERVRESNGVVLCVGVGWVLDCERENKWLDESLYAVDTSLIPRGGQRRRKSMEPKALANLNGTLVPQIATPRSQIPTISPTKEFLNLDTPQPGTMDRRASTTWVRSPGSSPDELELSPLPPTPKTVDVRRYVENLGVDDSDDDESEAPDTPGFLGGKAVQMTAPVKKFRDEDADELARDKQKVIDKGLMHRLLAARRKSLQFAPKVGSRLNPNFAAV